MKIAAPYHNGFVNEHFGHSATFAVFTINPENQILDHTLIATDEGCGCKSGIGARLAREGVTVMLAGNIGAGAIHHLYTEGIQVISGCIGLAEEAVTNYLKGGLTDAGQTCTQQDGCSGHPH